MSGELRQFLLQRGRVPIDDLLPARMIGWIGGAGAVLIGSTLVAVSIGFSSDFEGVAALIVFPVVMAIFSIPIGICVAIPFVWLVQMLGRLNGLSAVVVGATISLLVALLVDFPFGVIAVFVGIGAAAAAWHAGAHYSNEAV